MDANTYGLEQLVATRLEEARAAAARRALVESVRPARRDLPAAVAIALIRTGRWIGRHRALHRRHARLRVSGLGAR